MYKINIKSKAWDEKKHLFNTRNDHPWVPQTNMLSIEMKWVKIKNKRKGKKIENNKRRR